MKKVAIIGAGPGGLAAGLILSTQGFQVEIFEKDQVVGGRSKQIDIDGFKFDVGPTFLVYIKQLISIFTMSGYDIHDYLKLIKLESLYDLYYDQVFYEMPNYMIMHHQNNYQKWLDHERIKFNHIEPIMERSFTSIKSFMTKDVIKARPYINLNQSLFDYLLEYFKDEKVAYLMSFQSKYLGMSPYKAPSLFTMLTYLEHEQGLYHVIGGLSKIFEVMAKLIIENKGQIHLNKAVDQIIIKDRKACGIRLKNQDIKYFDYVIANSDFGYTLNHLIEQKHLKKYQLKHIKKKEFSFSTMMFYIGLDQIFPFKHHTMIFSNDYKTYLKNFYVKPFDVNNFTFYMHNPSLMDDTYAAKNQSSLYILVPIPNLKDSDCCETLKEHIFDQIINQIKKIYNIDLKAHIITRKIITPIDWQDDYHVHLGSVFNLSHLKNQLLHQRPHHQFEDIKNLYLVGGATHPGSGLPTIFASAKITTQLINKKEKRT